MTDLEHPEVYIYERNPHIRERLKEQLSEGLIALIPDLKIKDFDPLDRDQSLFLLPQDRVFLVNSSAPLAVDEEQQKGIQRIEEIAKGLDAQVIQYEISGGEENGQVMEINDLADIDKLCIKVRESLGI